MFPEEITSRKYYKEDVDAVFDDYLQAIRKTFIEFNVADYIYSISFTPSNTKDFCSMYFLPKEGGTVVEIVRHPVD